MLSIMNTQRVPSYIIGIDEVGRGPLAGPVVVCAVAIPKNLCLTKIVSQIPLRDSKKLTSSQRRAWATSIKSNGRIHSVIASASSTLIDRINVTRSANRAVSRTLAKLLPTLPSPCRVSVFLDGGLFVHETRTMKYEKRGKSFSILTHSNAKKTIRFSATTIIKGDETISTISLASIVAKEHRDTLMHRAHKKYPHYGFDHHVGYGTKKHISAIKKHGASPLHRKSFLKKIKNNLRPTTDNRQRITL